MCTLIFSQKAFGGIGDHDLVLHNPVSFNYLFVADEASFSGSETLVSESVQENSDSTTDESEADGM